MKSLLAALLGALVVSACTPNDPPVRIPKVTPEIPGAEGRAVLRITPKPQHPLGAIGASEGPVLKAIMGLDGTTSEEVVELRRHLDSESVRVRDAAITVLAQGVHEDAGLALLAALEDPHPVLREQAVEALDAMSAERRDQLLDRALRGGDPSAARGAGSHWARLVNNPLSAGARVASLFHDAADPVAQALMVSENCGRLSPALAAAADASSIAIVRASSLVCSAERAGAATTIDVTPFIEALASENPAVQRRAATLVERVNHRIAAADAPKLSEALVMAYRDGEPELEIAVAAAQASLSAETAVTTLAIRVRSDNSDRRLLALEALARHAQRVEVLDDSAITPALQLASQDDDSTVRRMVAELAGVTRDGQIDRLLASLVTDPVVRVRFAAVYAIGQAKAMRAVGEVVEIALEDKDATVRDCGYVALHRMVHDFPMPPPSMVTSWLNDPGDVGKRTFWGRDHVEWRGWYQSDERQ